MASVALVRVSGSVLSVPKPRGGFIKAGPRQGEEWSIETVNVLVADQNVTAVQLPRRDATGVFEGFPNKRSFLKNDDVDFLVEVSVYQQDVQARVVGAWPDEEDDELAA